MKSLNQSRDKKLKAFDIESTKSETNKIIVKNYPDG